MIISFNVPPTAPPVQPDPSIQIWTLIIAALAAFAAVFAAVLAAVSASRRDRSAWLRQEQTEAYEAFSAAAWAGVDETTAGAVERAIQHPEFQGLESAASALGSHSTKMLDAARRIAVVGGPNVVRESMEFVAVWIERCHLTVPLSGTAHVAAHEQRSYYIGYFTQALLRLAATMREDLGLMSRKGRKGLAVERATSSPLPPLHFRDAQEGAANLVLREWKVRRWGTESNGPHYTVSDTPWALLNLQHNVLFQPLVAVVRKIPGAAWIAAIDDSLSSKQVDQIERDIASLVTTHGTTGDLQYGGSQWVAGELEGERVYWWTEAGAPPAQ